METYKSDLGQFRKKTPLTLFCRAQKRKRVRLSPDFQEVVAEFDWRNDVMLEDVEQFRQEYASHYGLHEFAMMVAQVRPGSFIVLTPSVKRAYGDQGHIKVSSSKYYMT